MSTTGTMQGSEVEARVRRLYEELFDKQDPNLLDRYVDANVVDETTGPVPQRGIEALKAFYRDMFRAFPDARFTMNEVVSADDAVAVHWTFYGTHEGEFFGVPASGKQVQVNGCEIDLFENGRITRFRGVVDQLTLLQQIGAIEPPGDFGG